MSAAELQVMEIGPMLRGWVKDKTYQHTPVGSAVGRYLRALQWEGKSARTLESYEHTLAYLALDHSDFLNLDEFCNPVGVEYIRDYLARRWGAAKPATKRQRHSALAGFFTWSVGEGLLPWTPMKNIQKPAAEDTERMPMPQDLFEQLVDMQDSLRDRCALQLLGRIGLRKDELRVLRVGEIDLARNFIQIHGKGSVVKLMPIGFKSLRDDLYLHLLERDRGDYLLYARERRDRPMNPASVHRWFKRCLNAAGVDDYEIHALRHLAADAIYRHTGDLVMAQMLLRHKSVTTTQTYIHPSRADLAAAMEAMDRDRRDG